MAATIDLTNRNAFINAIGLHKPPQRQNGLRTITRPTPQWRGKSKVLFETQKYREAHPCVHWDGVATGKMCGLGNVYGCAVYGQCSYCTRDAGSIHSCVTCRDYTEKVTPVEFKRIRSKPLVWAVGVTTAPRAIEPHKSPLMVDAETRRKWKQGPAIEWTLEGLANAGFGDVTVFAEPGSHRPASGYARWIDRPETFGSWRNWKTSLDQLLNDNPNAEAIMLVQDDCIFCKGIREFLDETLWPHNVGVVSLYGSGKYANNQGIRTVHSGAFWGALALIFPRNEALEILHSPVTEHRISGNKIDIRVGRWCRSAGKNLWVFTPSLAQHIGGPKDGKVEW